MILCIGEILADMLGEEVNGTTEFKMFCGGAPFNVAVNAKQFGAKVGFVGKVGRDPVGKFLINYASKVGFEYLEIDKDEIRNTTLAFVTLTNGERDFAFFRHDTADFNLEADKMDLDKYKDLNIAHLGSLMLSEQAGRDFADRIIEKVDKKGCLLSFDVNFRMDLYDSLEDAIKAYKPYVDRADILKFSDDEILDYTGKNSLEDAISELNKKDRLLLITLGSKGSVYVYNNCSGVIQTEKVKPIDTTGAGDAFFGTLLANLDGKEFTVDNIENAMIEANKSGARATQFKGAVKL